MVAIPQELTAGRHKDSPPTSSQITVALPCSVGPSRGMLNRRKEDKLQQGCPGIDLDARANLIAINSLAMRH
jgi:hypothetical protein